MAKQEQKTSQKRTPQETIADETTKAESLVDEEALDSLLDEIDDVLEVNAEVFVKEYRQQGGE
jgi:ubiquitin-like protein Pup